MIEKFKGTSTVAFVVWAAVATIAAGCSTKSADVSEGVQKSTSALTLSSLPDSSECDASPASCCPPGSVITSLTESSDVFQSTTPNACILALGGNDTVFALSGDPAALFLGSGDDTAMAGPGAETVRGGDGRDTINAWGGPKTIYGNAGDDVISASGGDQFVVPGPGADTVSTGEGNDTVAVFDLCEVSPGDHFDGGSGQNTLLTPVPLSTLESLGVSVSNFETIKVEQHSCISECVARPDCSGHGQCAEGSATGQVRCACNPGWLGEHCEIAAVKPVVECVTRFDPTHANAIFGYQNSSGTTVSVALGADNRFDPADPSAETQPPTSFAPGSPTPAIVGAFFGDQLSWTLLGQTVTANASTPPCTLSNVAASRPPRPGPISGESAGRPGPVIQGLVPADATQPSTRGFAWQKVPNPKPQPSQGTTTCDSDGVCTIQQGLTDPANAPFIVKVTDFFYGGSTCTDNDPFFEIFINGVQVVGQNDGGTVTIPCGICAACATHYTPNATFAGTNVAATDPTVTVRVVIVNNPKIGSNSNVVDKTITVPNFGDQSNLFGSLEDWGISFTTHSNFTPKLCMTWSASFMDSGSSPSASSPFPASENYLLAAPGAVQAVPASGALVNFTVSRDGGSTAFSAVLDQDGCLPAENAPIATDLFSNDPNLTIVAQLDSEFCVDATGKNCLDSQNKITQGALFSVQTVDANDNELGPLSLCTVLSNDPTAASQHPNCQVQALPWTVGARPPMVVTIGNAQQSDQTRVSAVVSTIVKREQESSGDLGVELGARRHLDGESNIVVVNANKFCHIADGAGVPGLDTCADSSSSAHPEAEYRPDSCCPIGQDVSLSCRPASSAADCTSTEQFAYGDSRWKYIVAHELGHIFQSWLTGASFCAKQGCLYNPNHGMAGAPNKCRCDFVTSANAEHCLQSINTPDIAQTEGFAQYFAARTYNRDDSPTCVFRYYKEFLDDTCRLGVDQGSCEPNASGGVVNHPPVPVDCRTPIRWRNNFCAGSEALPLPTLGVEYDWMGFYLSWTTQSADRSFADDVSNVFSTASNQGAERISFAGDAENGSLSGAASQKLSSDQFRHFVSSANSFGVSNDLSK